MRIGLLAALLICMSSASQTLPPAASDETMLVDEEFFATLDAMIPVSQIETAEDRFVVYSAVWHGEDRFLVVDVSTEREKGTLFTLMGLPESTMLDAFQINSNHRVKYVLPLDTGQAVPCQVIVRTAFSSAVVDVADAPQACEERLQLSGHASVGPEKPMVNGWVTAIVDNTVFATIADESGRFDLEIYAGELDANVTITAEGTIDEQQSVIHIFSGSIATLMDQSDLSASAWAAEILGRRHKRPMHASVDHGR